MSRTRVLQPRGAGWNFVMEGIFVIALAVGLYVAPSLFPDALNPIPKPIAATAQIHIPLNPSLPSVNSVPLDLTFVLSGNHTIVGDSLKFEAIARAESNSSVAKLGITKIVISPDNALALPIAVGQVLVAVSTTTTSLSSVGVQVTSYTIRNGTAIATASITSITLTNTIININRRVLEAFSSISLNQTGPDLWDGSQLIEYTVPGQLGATVEVDTGNTSQAFAVPSLFPIGGQDSVIIERNTALTTTLTFFIVGFAALDLRVEHYGGKPDSSEPKKRDSGSSE